MINNLAWARSDRISSDARYATVTRLRPKIALVAANSCWNLVNFRRNIIAALQADGFRVVAVAPRDAYSEALERLGVDLHPIDMQTSGVSPRRDLMLLLRYVALMRKLKPDIYLGFTIKPNIYGSLAARFVGSPVINNITGLGTTFTNQTWLTRLVTALYRLALRRSSTVFFQNRDDLALFKEQGIVRTGQARLLPGSGVDLERFRGRRAGHGVDDGFGFLFIARLLWEKGIGEYVEAAAIVRAAEASVRCRVLGFLDVDNRGAVPRSVLDRWVADGVIDYLGVSDDVRPYLDQADCIVLPSYYREGIPRSLLEAAAMGKPIIAIDAPGMREIVDDGVTGYLVEPRDAQSLADAMLRMVRLPPMHRREIGNAGRRKAEREFGQDIVTRRYRDAIARVLGTDGRPSSAPDEPGSPLGS